MKDSVSLFNINDDIKQHSAHSSDKKVQNDQNPLISGIISPPSVVSHASQEDSFPAEAMFEPDYNSFNMPVVLDSKKKEESNVSLFTYIY